MPTRRDQPAKLAFGRGIWINMERLRVKTTCELEDLVESELVLPQLIDTRHQILPVKEVALAQPFVPIGAHMHTSWSHTSIQHHPSPWPSQNYR